VDRSPALVGCVRARHDPDDPGWGRDQIAMNMTLLLLPIALADGRRWHWDRGPAVVPAGRQLTSLVSWSAGLVIRLQVAGLYFQACVAKLSHDEWANGTALYYWMSDPLFGLPNWVRPVMEPILLSSVGVQAITWGALVTEFCLFMGLTAKRSVRPWLLAAGFGLHLGIAVLMGLWSFSLAMMGCLVLYLRPLDLPWPAPGLVFARVSSLLRGRQRRTPVRAHSVLALERSDQA